MVARALHAVGVRRDGPFVAVNCAAVPPALLESELFGHVRGAFTDARVAREGLFAKASGGTLFLDEIADLPIAVQPKLLRALQDRVVRPIGGEVEIACDVRFVTATNRSLEAAVAAGSFREDLYFRLSVVPVEVPPLRVRGRDILVLAHHFVEREAARYGGRRLRLSPPAAERLLAYAWPGNVRELQNCIERAAALAAGLEIRVADLPEPIRRRQGRRVHIAESVHDLVPLSTVEDRHIRRVLNAVRGNRSIAAKILRLDRKTLRRRLRQMSATRES